MLSVYLWFVVLGAIVVWQQLQISSLRNSERFVWDHELKIGVLWDTYLEDLQEEDEEENFARSEEENPTKE